MNARVSSFQHVVLCTTVLGGAEIFALERMRVLGHGGLLHCNASLAHQIRLDPRYEGVELHTHACLEPLAITINAANIKAAVLGLGHVLRRGPHLLGNLRAAALLLHPSTVRRHDAFIHDNSHYLNLKAKGLISAIVAASRSTCFPCWHSTLRVPFARWIAGRMKVDYFADYLPLPAPSRKARTHLNVAMVGRIEPAKNQGAGMAIASSLAAHFDVVNISLLGARSDETYCRELMGAATHPNVTATQLQLPRSDVSSFLSQQDCVLHTSIAESLPLVLFETNQQGIPFFALPVGGIPEVLPNSYWLDQDVDRSVQTIRAALGCSDTHTRVNGST